MGKTIRQPRAIADAEAAVASQEAAEAAIRQNVAQPHDPVSGEQPAAESHVSADHAVVPNADDHAVNPPPAEDAMDKAQKEVADLTAQITVLREEHKVATAQVEHYKQAWSTLQGLPSIHLRPDSR